MRICLVSTIFPPAMGGPSIQTYHLASALNKAGHQVTVITPKNPERQPEMATTMQGVNLVEAGMIKNTIASKIGWKLALAQAVLRELCTARYDVLHCQNGPGLAALLVGWVAQLCGVSSFAKFPADEVLHRANTYRRVCLDPAKLYKLNWKTRFWSAVQILALRTYSVVWTVHSYDYSNLRRLFGFSADRVCLFPNLQHLEIGDPSSNERAGTSPVTVCACRLVAIKGVDLLIQAYARVPEDIRGELWVFGEGVPSIVRELEQLVQDLGLDGQVKLLGKVSPLVMSDYLKQASVYLNTLTHRYYGAGYVEAMSAGVCIVALNLGLWPEVADFEDIPALVGKNVGEVAALLERVLRDPLLRQRYARQGQEFVRQLDMDAHLGLFLQAYERAISISTLGK